MEREQEGGKTFSRSSHKKTEDAKARPPRLPRTSLPQRDYRSSSSAPAFPFGPRGALPNACGQDSSHHRPEGQRRPQGFGRVCTMDVDDFARRPPSFQTTARRANVRSPATAASHSTRAAVRLPRGKHPPRPRRRGHRCPAVGWERGSRNDPSRHSESPATFRAIRHALKHVSFVESVQSRARCRHARKEQVRRVTSSSPSSQPSSPSSPSWHPS
jgi:hypothetical protein